MTMVVPQPAKGQFIDVAAIVSAIGAINTAITNVIGAGLRDISGALGAVNGVLNAIQNFFRPPASKRCSSPEMRATSARYPTGTPPFISPCPLRLTLQRRCGI